jgi:hypothetical protein
VLQRSLDTELSWNAILFLLLSNPYRYRNHSKKEQSQHRPIARPIDNFEQVLPQATPKTFNPLSLCRLMRRRLENERKPSSGECLNCFGQAAINLPFLFKLSLGRGSVARNRTPLSLQILHPLIKLPAKRRNANRQCEGPLFARSIFQTPMLPKPDMRSASHW